MRSVMMLLVCLMPFTVFAKLKVVTTIPDLADIAQAVGGDRIEATALTKGTQDPHFADPKPSMMLALNKADLLIAVGLELEQGWLPPLQQGARNAKVLPGGSGYLEVSQFVPLLEVRTSVDRGEGDVHKGGNPHFWLDPERVRMIAAGISAQLTALDPEGKASYAVLLADYDSKLQRKIGEWKSALEPYRGSRVIVYHRSWSYFLSFAELSSVGELEPKPGVEPSPASVSALLERTKQLKPQLMIQEAYYPQNLSKAFAKKAGAKALVLPTMVGAQGTKSYTEVIDGIVYPIVEALKGGETAK